MYFATPGVQVLVALKVEREHWTEQANIQINIYTMDKQIKVFLIHISTNYYLLCVVPVPHLDKFLPLKELNQFL